MLPDKIGRFGLIRVSCGVFRQKKEDDGPTSAYVQQFSSWYSVVEYLRVPLSLRQSAGNDRQRNHATTNESHLCDPLMQLREFVILFDFAAAERFKNTIHPDARYCRLYSSRHVVHPSTFGLAQMNCCALIMAQGEHLHVSTTRDEG